MDCIDCVNQKYCKNRKNLGEQAHKEAMMKAVDEYVAEVQKEMQKILSGELNNGNR